MSILINCSRGLTSAEGTIVNRAATFLENIYLKFVSSPSSSLRGTFFSVYLSVATGFAQNVGGFVHAKIQNFSKPARLAPVVSPTAPFQFGSLITMGTATINSATVTFTGTGPRSYSPEWEMATFRSSIPSRLSRTGRGIWEWQLQSSSIITSAGTFSRSIFYFLSAIPRPHAHGAGSRLAKRHGCDWIRRLILILPGTHLPTRSPLTASNSSLAIQPTDRCRRRRPLSPSRRARSSLGRFTVVILLFSGLPARPAETRTSARGTPPLVKNTGFMLRTQAPALALTAAVSRKIHGGTGTFDVDLPLSGRREWNAARAAPSAITQSWSHLRIRS